MTSIQVHYSNNIMYHYIILSQVLGTIIGFSNLGDINSHLQAYKNSLEKENIEQPIATSMLVLMVRGLFSKLQFPYVQFPCTSVSGHQFYDVFWEATCRLERCGFKVLACTCDGLSANRRFFKLHGSGSAALTVHKVFNTYSADKRSIFFFSDPPHLIKTVRNCWSSSKRLLWVCI